MARDTGAIDPLADTPLSVDDTVEAGRNIRAFARDREWVQLFVRRAYATTKALTELRTSFDVELERRSRSVGSGTPSNMSPEVAARFLSPEQLTRIFDRFMQEKLAMVESQRRSLELSLSQVGAVQGALSEEVGRILSDPGLDLETRSRIAEALNRAVATTQPSQH